MMLQAGNIGFAAMLVDEINPHLFVLYLQRFLSSNLHNSL
jgi:hypothetical protein